MKLNRSFFILLAGASLLGFAAIFVKLASAEAASEVIGFYRMLFALPVAYLLMMRSQTPGLLKEKLKVVFAGVLFSGYLYLWHIAISITTAANATFIVGMSPLWVALVNVLLGYRFHKTFYLGLCTAIGGAAILSMAKGGTISLAQGEMVALLSSFGYAGLTLLVTNGRKTLQAVETLFYVVLGSFITFCIIVMVKQSVMGPFSLQTWGSFLGLSFVIQLAAWVIITKSMTGLSSSVVSIGLLMQQVMTPLFGVIILSEFPVFLEVVGSLILVLGMVISALKR